MFGISTFCLHRQPLEVALETLRPHTDTVEVMDEGLHHLTSPDLLGQFSCRYCIHAPSRGVNIASLLEPIRRASVQVIGDCFAIAGEVDAGVVIHPGYYAWVEEREAALAAFAGSLAELRAIADDHSVSFCVENMGNWEYFFLRTPDEVEMIEGCGLALDVGHAHLNGCLPEFLEVPFSHVHLHDNDGLSDSHVAVGEGDIPFAPVMEAVRRNGATPIVEVNTLEGCLWSIHALEAL